MKVIFEQIVYSIITSTNS